MSSPNGPDFLGIGAQKAGSTWLDRNLRKHPDLWLPPIKELHYFTERELVSLGAMALFFGKPWIKRRLRRLLLGRIKSDIRYLDIQGIKWDLRYFFGYRNDEWYLSLFPQSEGKVSGEISPSYSILSKDKVKRVYKMLPELKLIFIMRDPVDRSWSQLRMDFGVEGRSLSELTPEILFDSIKNQRVFLRSNYVRTLENWGEYYSDEQIFIGFLEELKDSPEDFLMRIFRFLGVDTKRKYVTGLAHRKVGAAKNKPEIPRPIERELASLHIEDLRLLDERYGGYTTDWRVRAERILQMPRR